MLRVALRGILSRRWRLLTTGIAILLGVAFISGTDVLSDVLTRGANGLIDAAYRGIDVQVRSSAATENEFSSQPVRPEVDASLLDTIRATKGVAVAEGQIQAQATMLDKKGKPLPTVGPPTFLFNWIDNPDLVGGTVTSGRAPNGPDEAALDFKTAEEFGFRVGDHLTMQLPKGPATFTIVGLGGIGKKGDQSAGARSVLVDTARAQQLLGIEGKFSSIVVKAAPGVTQDQLAKRIGQILPDKVEAITGEALIKETQASIAQILGVITDLVAAFGWLAVFVALFVIYNTFSILIAQRTREMALLRAVGASRGQILGSVILEATVVGLVAAVLGVAVGFVLAAGLQNILASFIPLAKEPARLTTSAIVTSLIVGVVATVASALGPAIRATRIPPVAAISETAVEPQEVSLRRKVFGALLVVGGVAAVLLAVQKTLEPVLTWVGAGAAMLFLSVLVIGPTFAGRVTAWLGAPLRLLDRTTGRIAQQNAVRNPKRTTATAAALTIGVGVVAVIAVVAASFKGTFTDVFQNQIRADYVVDSGGQFGTGMPPEVLAAVQQVPGVADASSLRLFGGIVLNSKKAAEQRALPRSELPPALRDSTAPVGEPVLTAGIEPKPFTTVFDLGRVTPGLSAVRDDGVMIEKKLAADNGWKIGDRVEFYFAQQHLQGGDGRIELPIVATYDKSFAIGGDTPLYFMTQATFAKLQPPQLNVDQTIYFNTAAGASGKTVARAVTKAIEPISPVASVVPIGKYFNDRLAPINGFLNLVYGLLALAVVVALVGIWNTLLLSIYERTREIGLLRAIGMERRKVRRAVRMEAAVIALFGTVMGIALGVALSLAFVNGFADQGIKLHLPTTQLVVIAVGGAFAGVLAALWPAFKASRTNMLEAIATT